jgi:hypothetical protein
MDHRKGQRALKKEQRRDLTPDLQKGPKMEQQKDQMTAQKDQPTKQRKGHSTRWGYRSLDSAEKKLQTYFNSNTHKIDRLNQSYLKESTD